MTLNKILVHSMTFLLLVCSTSIGHEKKWPERRLRQAWPQAQSFTSKQVSLTSSQISELKSEGVQIDSKDRSPIFYFAQSKVTSGGKPQTLGLILFIDSYGANGPMEITVGLSSDGLVQKIDIWEHTENSSVTKEAYLKQFIGKSSKDPMLVNKDYQPVSEAPKASESIALAVQKALKISNVAFKKN
ncbi:MAG: hypothetical protein B7Y39_04515 [Bdellovibrio sp. 28-41-41]|nr:MAG: hypothetical protein B7Y39_04515 [Bdellovibrio sp. 28-41-41]